MSNKGRSVFQVNSDWSSGNLVFFEKAVGRTVTGDVLSIGTEAVKIGGTSQDIDFQWYASGLKSFVIDAGDGTLTIAGIDVSLTGDLTIDTKDINLGDGDDLEFGDSQDVLMRFSLADESDPTFVLALDDTSQQMHITDKGAVATDWARSAGTHPELAIHSNTTPITDYLAIGNHDGTTAHINVVGGTTLSIDIEGTAEYTFTASAIDFNDNNITELGDVTTTDGSIITPIDGTGTTLLIKAGGLTGTTFITLTSQSAGTDTMSLGAFTLSGAVAGGDQAFTGVGDMTFTDGSILTAIDGAGTTLLIKAGGLAGTTFITLTSQSAGTDTCEIDGATLDTAVGKGTWTASGTWTLPAVTLGGAVTANSTLGISGLITSTSTTGFRSLPTFVPNETRTNYALVVGTRATELNVTMAAAINQNLDPIQMNLNIIGANPLGSSTINGIYQLITHDSFDMSNLRLKCADWNVVVGMDILDAYCYQGEIDFNAANITVGGEAVVLGLVMNAGSAAVTGTLRGATIAMTGAGMPATSSGLFIYAGTGATLTHGLYLATQGGTILTNAIYIETGGTLTNVLKFGETSGAVVSKSDSGTTQSYTIRCAVGGVTGYLHLYTD